MQGTPATVEAELEEDIQREIEAELKKEISLLSQKLAVLQTRHGTFVQSPNRRPKSSLHCDDSERLHGEATRNGNSNTLVQSNQFLSTQEKISQSQISTVSSEEKQHPVNITYMRIIELVADTGNQHSAKKSTLGSRQCLASDKGSLSSLLMEVKQK